jgi:hypothetical protein
MGVPREWIFGALRLTFGRESTDSVVETLLASIPPLVIAARTRLLAVV